ncbi:MAG: hypothetical protein EB059_06100 [Alphaproteobacteria bacterium]|nr:hypothetical protein [Alphaproteobacteria bacterium]
MLPALAFSLLSTFGLEDTPQAVYPCTTPAFSVTRNEKQLSGQHYLELKGVLAVPQPGYHYGFQFVTQQAPQAYAILSVGQAVQGNKPYGRGLPSVQQLPVNEKFNLPDAVTQLHVRIEGLTKQPVEFTCTITLAAPASTGK